jgi:2-dehydropantoate 2-reductase
MRFVVVGAGGVGGCLGARLTEAGHDVAYLVRGATLDALTSAGLTLESPQGTVALGRQRASDNAGDLGPAEAVIVSVKLYSLAEVAPQLPPLVGPATVVLPLQNGIDAYPILAGNLGADAVLKGTISIKSFRAAPGRIVCKSPFARIKFGEADSRKSDRAAALAEILNACTGVEATLSDDIDRDLWFKFLMLASFSAVACMARATIGQVLDDPAARSLVVQAAEEVAAIGRAEGIDLPSDVAGLVERQVKDMPRDGRASMLEDLDAGRPLELDYLSGTAVRLGERHAIPTPVHDIAYRALHLHAAGSQAPATAPTSASAA